MIGMVRWKGFQSQALDIALQTTNQEVQAGRDKEKQRNREILYDMRGQGYDGAANISGIYNGLQFRLQRRNPKALYVHCQAHSLNLVLVEIKKSSIQFLTFFSLVEKLYASIANSSKRHAALMEIQKAMYPEDRSLEPKKLSDTRWAYRESALRTMRKVISALKQFLEEIVQKYPLDAPEGETLILLQSINFEFLVCPEITTQVFQETAYASNALQQKKFDLAASYRIVDEVLQSLRELRNDEKFQKIFTNTKERAESMAIDLASGIPGQGRRRKMPERYKYSATSATEDQQYQYLDEYYHMRIFYVFLDT
ncbi:zinc finger MYM-type protein 1-like [Palaemon carinicauda]|uniref:zinc finger MYM-type protein 1-like n=1 Tax=Palaemon carinicauda TaxID=392227 RepID=UPI0035B5C0BD